MIGPLQAAIGALALGGLTAAPPVVRDGGSVAGTIYVAAFKATEVVGFDERARGRRKPACTVSGVKAVNDIGVDPSGTLWVPEQNGDGGVVASYAPHCGAPGIVLLDEGGYPWAVAFGPDGTNYVLNSEDTPSSAGSVFVYRKGSVRPARHLTDPSLHMLAAVGVDATGNVYASSTAASGPGVVVEFPLGRMPGVPLSALQLPGYPGGTLLFDRAGNLVMNDLTGYIDVFAPPFDGPPQRFATQGLSWQCGFNHRQTRIACADYAAGGVDVYAYPSVTYLYSVTGGLEKVDTVVGLSFDPD